MTDEYLKALSARRDLTEAQKAHRERLARLLEYERRLDALRLTPEHSLDRFLDKFVGFKFNVW